MTRTISETCVSEEAHPKSNHLIDFFGVLFYVILSQAWISPGADGNLGTEGWWALVLAQTHEVLMLTN